MSDQTHWVYVIATREGQEVRAPVKVGMTGNPNMRFDALQTASPFDLVLYSKFALLTKNMARDIESCFHYTQRKHRTRGEWFNLPPAQASFLVLFHIRCCLSAFSDLNESEVEQVMRFVETGA